VRFEETSRRDPCPPRKAPGANGTARRRPSSRCVASGALRIALPVAASAFQVTPLALVERDEQAMIRQPAPIPGSCFAQATCFDPGAVARFAGDIDFRPFRRVRVVRRFVVALELRRMAIGAHPVPVSDSGPGPVQRIGRRDVFVGIQVIPMARRPAPSFRASPRDRQRPAMRPSGKRDEILLQWIQPERVADFEIGQLAVGTIGV